MRRRRTAVVGLILVLLGADEPRILSGYQPGEFIRPCPVEDVTGPHAGKAICYKCFYSPEPVICIVTKSKGSRRSRVSDPDWRPATPSPWCGDQRIPQA